METKRVYLRKTEQILAAAEALFLAQGYVGTSMQEVATRAQVAKATLYSNFSSKEDLFSAVIRRRAEENQADENEVARPSRSLHRTLVSAAVSFLLDIYSREQIELFQTVVADSRQFPHIGKMMLESAFVKTQSKITRLFAEKIASGEIAYDDARMATEYFIGIIKAAKHIPLVFSQPADVSRSAIERIADQAVCIFLNGINHCGRPRRSTVRRRES